jgi:hypothetical protein
VATIERVSRLAVLAAAVLAAAVVPASGAAGAQAASCQPDVSIAQRGDRAQAGEDLYSADAVGQTRNVLITKQRVVLVVRIQNDGTAPCSFLVTGSHGTDGFDIQYTAPGTDVTADVIAGTYALQDLPPSATRRVVVRVAAEVDVSLGAKRDVLVRAVSTTAPNLVDAARATVTKVTEPLGP